MQTTTQENYSAAQKDAMLREFDQVLKRFSKVMAHHYGAEGAIEIGEDARHEYELLIPQLPYIGGKRNPLTWNLIGAAWFLALYRVLRKRGEPVEKIGKITYEMFEAWYNAYPRFLLRLLGWWKFTPFAFWALQRRAEQSQARRYPGDWVFSALKGDKKAFDWGVDYSECGIAKFYHEQGADEFIPYLCPLDYLMSERFGLGLVRTMTIGTGAKVCDFRFKRGQETEWPAQYLSLIGRRFDKPLHILVYGAGVLGSLVAARLKGNGHHVALLARGQRLVDLRQHGIVLEESAIGLRSTTHIEIVEQLEPTDAYDWVIVVMRKNQVHGILPILAANQHTPNVLFLGNNVTGALDYINAIGRERVVLGFLASGGAREGQAIRILTGAAGIKGHVTIGEIDGLATPRIQQLANIFATAGFPVAINPNMEAWLKTYAALVGPIAAALYAVGGDNYRLARRRDAVVLGVRAMRESFQVLRQRNIPLLPGWVNLLRWLPEPILVPLLQRLFNTQLAEIAMARHANAARDEMKELADEFRALTRATTVATPALDRLARFIDPSVPTMTEGHDQLPLDWRGVWLGLGVIAALGWAVKWLVRAEKGATHEQIAHSRVR